MTHPTTPSGRRTLTLVGTSTLARTTRKDRQSRGLEKPAQTYQTYCTELGRDWLADATTTLPAFVHAHREEGIKALGALRRALERLYRSAGSTVMDDPAIRELWREVTSPGIYPPLIDAAHEREALHYCEKTFSRIARRRNRAIVLLHTNGLHPDEIAFLNHNDFAGYPGHALLTVRAPRPLVRATRTYWLARNADPNRCAIVALEKWIATWPSGPLFPQTDQFGRPRLLALGIGGIKRVLTECARGVPEAR